MSGLGGQEAMAATHAGAAVPSARTADLDNRESVPSRAAPAATDSSQAATVHQVGSRQPEQLDTAPTAPPPRASAKSSSAQASRATSAPRPVAEAIQSLRQAPPPSASHVAALWQQHKARQQQQQHQKLREAQQNPYQQQHVTPSGSPQLYSVAHPVPSPAAAGTPGMSSPHLYSRQHLHEPHQVPGITQLPSQRPQAGRQSSQGATAPPQNQAGSYRLPGSRNGTLPGGTAGAVPALHSQLSSTPDGLTSEISEAPRTPGDGEARRRQHGRHASVPPEWAQTSQQPAVAG